MQALTVIRILLISLFAVQNANAGEFKCLINCRLDGIYPDIKWEPTGCLKPHTPYLVVVSPSDYNDAVRLFNSWLSEVDAYNACVQNEAVSDLKKLPDVFRKGVEEARERMSNEVRTIRSRLEIQRPR